MVDFRSQIVAKSRLNLEAEEELTYGELDAHVLFEEPAGVESQGEVDEVGFAL